MPAAYPRQQSPQTAASGFSGGNEERFPGALHRGGMRLLLFLHHFQHHPCSQTEAALEQGAGQQSTEFLLAVHVLGQQFLLGIRQCLPELVLVTADQLNQLFVFFAPGYFSIRWFDVPLPPFFQDFYIVSPPSVTQTYTTFPGRKLLSNTNNYIG